MIGTIRSVPDPAAIVQEVRHRYGLDLERGTLLRSLANDVYLVHGPDGRYAAKVYRTGTDRERLRWEDELARHAVRHGVPVPTARPTTGGEPVLTLEAPEGPRHVVVLEWVEGTKPAPPFGEDLYRELGDLLARFHAAADTFAPSASRPVEDVDTLVGAAVARVADVLNGPDRALVEDLGARATAALRRRRPSDLGVCHGDVTLDNVLVTDAGLSLHDFDLAGVRWRVSDLTGVAGTEHLGAFLTGYREVRPLPEDDLTSLGWLRAAASLQNLGFHLVDKPAVQGSDSIGEGWADRELETLRELSRVLEA
ncbi:phosphotransferase enzyme family protein [Georgenia alba]|uniref:Phosphotransferase enzyme family protein n=1 Tax=Georgenia alba TaxID=2233858 RepID=A0ABW2Q771_9MICO